MGSLEVHVALDDSEASSAIYESVEEVKNDVSGLQSNPSELVDSFDEIL